MTGNFGPRLLVESSSSRRNVESRNVVGVVELVGRGVAVLDIKS
jgi:hypothetical protein